LHKVLNFKIPTVESAELFKKEIPCELFKKFQLYENAIVYQNVRLIIDVSQILYYDLDHLNTTNFSKETKSTLQDQQKVLQILINLAGADTPGPLNQNTKFYKFSTGATCEEIEKKIQENQIKIDKMSQNQAKIKSPSPIGTSLNDIVKTIPQTEDQIKMNKMHKHIVNHQVHLLEIETFDKKTLKKSSCNMPQSEFGKKITHAQFLEHKKKIK
jgi:preprotein translocase subunit SecD